MRDPREIAADLELLVVGSDQEADHMHADWLLLELIQVLASDTQSASIADAARRACDARERASKHWWWA